jgi:hypothetical protein
VPDHDDDPGVGVELADPSQGLRGVDVERGRVDEHAGILRRAGKELQVVVFGSGRTPAPGLLDEEVRLLGKNQVNGRVRREVLMKRRRSALGEADDEQIRPGG